MDDEVRFLGGDHRFGQPAAKEEWREIEDCAVPWRWRDEAVSGGGVMFWKRLWKSVLALKPKGNE